MAVETPAHIVVAGLTPLGLETSLYARFLGYEVTLLGPGELCHGIRQRSEQPAEASRCLSRLGCLALEAQNPQFEKQQLLRKIQNQGDWWESYLSPLAETDLLIDSVKSAKAIRCVVLEDEESTEETTPPEDEDGIEISTSYFRIEFETEAAAVDLETIKADVLIDAQDPEAPGHFDFASPLSVEFEDDSATTPSMAASVRQNSTGENTDSRLDPARLLTSVEDFYQIGPKSFGKLDGFTHSIGMDQIRDLFKIIGDRESLDLYSDP